MADTTSAEHIAATRKSLEDLMQVSVDELGPCPPDLTQTPIDIPLQDGFISHSILIRPSLKTPTSSLVDNPVAHKKLSLVVLIHGGSFTYCSPKMMLSPARACVSHFNAVAVSIAYKLAPEHPFPAPTQSAWEVVAWLSKPGNLNSILHDEGLEVDPSLGFVLGGGSAGGNASAVIGGIDAMVKNGHHLDLIQGLPKIERRITGLFVTIPYLMDREIVPDEYLHLFTSREENADAPFINTKSLEDVAAIYQHDLKSPWFSPLNLDFSKTSSGLSQKVYVQCGELDIVRDDAVIYEKFLKARGLAETRIDLFRGYDHACWCNLPFELAHTPEMKEKTMDGVAWLLGMDWNRNVPLSH